MPQRSVYLNEQCRTKPTQRGNSAFQGFDLSALDVHLNPINSLQVPPRNKIVHPCCLDDLGPPLFVYFVPYRFFAGAPAYSAGTGPGRERHYFAVHNLVERKVFFQLMPVDGVRLESDNEPRGANCTGGPKRVPTDMRSDIHKNMPGFGGNPSDWLVRWKMQVTFHGGFILRDKPTVQGRAPPE